MVEVLVGTKADLYLDLDMDPNVSRILTEISTKTELTDANDFSSLPTIILQSILSFAFVIKVLSFFFFFLIVYKRLSGIFLSKRSARVLS